MNFFSFHDDFGILDTFYISLDEEKSGRKKRAYEPKKSKISFMPEIPSIYQRLCLKIWSKSPKSVLYQRRTCIDCMRHYENFSTKTVVSQDLKESSYVRYPNYFVLNKLNTFKI